MCNYYISGTIFVAVYAPCLPLRYGESMLVLYIMYILQSENNNITIKWSLILLCIQSETPITEIKILQSQSLHILSDTVVHSLYSEVLL